MFTESSLQTSDKIAEETHYFPFGLTLFKQNVSSNENKYQYNSKELIDEAGLDWYHYGARYYDPQVGRWWVVDPVDEQHSPYVYCLDNPLVFLDPDGEDIWGIHVGFSGLIGFGTLGIGGTIGLDFVYDTVTKRPSMLLTYPLDMGIQIGAGGNLEFGMYYSSKTVDDILGRSLTATGGLSLGPKAFSLSHSNSQVWDTRMVPIGSTKYYQYETRYWDTDNTSWTFNWAPGLKFGYGMQNTNTIDLINNKIENLVNPVNVNTQGIGLQLDSGYSTCATDNTAINVITSSGGTNDIIQN